MYPMKTSPIDEHCLFKSKKLYRRNPKSVLTTIPNGKDENWNWDEPSSGYLNASKTLVLGQSIGTLHPRHCGGS